MLVRSSLFILLIACASITIAQVNFAEKINFINHLKEQNLYEEGVLFINRAIDEDEKSAGQADSLTYFKGLFQYHLKDTEKSIASLAQIGQSNKRYWLHANFLTAFQKAYRGDYLSAAETLDVMKIQDPFYREVRAHEQAGVALLTRDFDGFENYSQQFSGTYFQLAQFQDQLKTNADGLQKMKRKSAFLAGLMSAVVPGSGKFYIGKVGEGYTTILLSTILALQAAEGYRKDGPSSVRFKLFASLFSTLYIVNVWGTVLSVKIYKDDINETFDQAILLNMHVPLRTIFD